MHPTTRLAALAVLAAACFPIPGPARAETYQTCTGFIDSLPATISTQGTWCLRKDVSTGMTSGAAITIAANNVTIDCNHFKLGGLAAGSATTATGIQASSTRQNVAIRQCNIRGFRFGVMLDGGAGHLIEDNAFDGNTTFGMYVAGGVGIECTDNLATARGNVVSGFATGIGLCLSSSNTVNTN